MAPTSLARNSPNQPRTTTICTSEDAQSPDEAFAPKKSAKGHVVKNGKKEVQFIIVHETFELDNHLIMIHYMLEM